MNAYLRCLLRQVSRTVIRFHSRPFQAVPAVCLLQVIFSHEGVTVEAKANTETMHFIWTLTNKAVLLLHKCLMQTVSAIIEVQLTRE